MGEFFIKRFIAIASLIKTFFLLKALRNGLEFYGEDMKMVAYVEFFLATILSIDIQRVIYELVRSISGLISGYSFGLFRILSFTIGRKEDKLGIYKEKTSRTLGQYLMIPPQKDENNGFPVKLYLLGGVIINFLIGVLCLYKYNNIPYTPFISQMLVNIGYVGIMFAFENGLPLESNDGMNVLLLRKDKIAKDIFYNQLIIFELLRQGKSYAHMPKELFFIPKNANYSNYIIINMLIFQYKRSQSIGNDEKAKELLEFILKQENILDTDRYMLKIEKIYYDVVDNPGNIDIESYLDKKTKRYMKETRHSMSTLRVDYLIKKFINKDENAAEKVRSLFEKKLSEFPYSEESVIERRLLKDALKKLTV